MKNQLVELIGKISSGCMTEQDIERIADEAAQAYADPQAFLAANSDINYDRLLLEHGVDPDGCGDDGRTALMMAAMFNRTEIVDYLLQQGADPRRQDVRGIDALGAAQTMGAPDTCAQLQTLVG